MQLRHLQRSRILRVFAAPFSSYGSSIQQFRDHNNIMEGIAPHVAVIGTGQIGAAVIAGIQRQKMASKVTAFDVSTKNRAEVEEAGAEWADSASSCVEGADVVITALPTPMHVQKLMEGESEVKQYGHFKCDGQPGDALLSKGLLKHNSLWIDHTTVSPAMAKHFRKISLDKSVRPIEAPLTGGYTLLKAGQMTVFLGGEQDHLREAMPLMKAYTLNQLIMGETGTAAVVKVISNQLAGAHQLLAAEGAALARAHGVDLDAFLHGIRVSAGNSYAFETELPLMFNQSFDPGFEVGLHIKDLEIGNKLAEEKGIEEKKAFPLFATTRKTYEEGAEKYGVLVGSTAPSRLVEERSNVNLAQPGYDEWSYEVQPIKEHESAPGGVQGMGVVHKNVNFSSKKQL